MNGMNFAEARYANIFATPLVTYVLQDVAELNASLRQQILAHQSESAGVNKSSRGGWHSEVGELEFCGDAGQRLIAHMRGLADEATRHVSAEFREPLSPLHWRIYAWANVNRAGDFNKMHVHPASTWSGTYYVDSGDPTNGAAPLHLFDPCPARTVSFLPNVVHESVYIHPKAGLMVLFPSYVPHMVFPHEGTGTRISIAFNLRKEPYP
jgi:uncharacterized protein (TIGR02466 family)